MAGDSLARGAKSAVFPPAKVSQERWDSIFGAPEKTKEKPAEPKKPLKKVWSK